MTTDKSTASDNQGSAAVNDGFVKIETERFMYNVEKCGKVPLQGYLLNLLEMPPIERGGEMMDWSAFLIKTTAPTKGIGRTEKGQAEQILDLPPGSEVLIPATNELVKFFSKAASSEQFVFEVRIQPGKKIDIGKGQTMWVYELAAKPNPFKRTSFGLAAVLGAAPRMLPEGSGATGNEAIPF